MSDSACTRHVTLSGPNKPASPPRRPSSCAPGAGPSDRSGGTGGLLIPVSLARGGRDRRSKSGGTPTTPVGGRFGAVAAALHAAPAAAAAPGTVDEEAGGGARRPLPPPPPGRGGKTGRARRRRPGAASRPG